MIPSDGRVHLPVASPTSAAFPKRLRGSAYPNWSTRRLHVGSISRSSLFLTFRPPSLLATQISPIAVP
jgi:hypothetical protein